MKYELCLCNVLHTVVAASFQSYYIHSFYAKKKRKCLVKCYSVPNWGSQVSAITTNSLLSIKIKNWNGFRKQTHHDNLCSEPEHDQFKHMKIQHQLLVQPLQPFWRQNFCKGLIFQSNFSCTIMYKITNCSQVHQFHLLMWVVVLVSGGCTGRVNYRSHIWKKHSRHLSNTVWWLSSEAGAGLWRVLLSLWGAFSCDMTAVDQLILRANTHVELLYVLVVPVWISPFITCLKWLISFLLGLHNNGLCLITTVGLPTQWWTMSDFW